MWCYAYNIRHTSSCTQTAPPIKQQHPAQIYQAHWHRHLPPYHQRLHTATHCTTQPLCLQHPLKICCYCRPHYSTYTLTELLQKPVDSSQQCTGRLMQHSSSSSSLAEAALAPQASKCTWLAMLHGEQLCAAQRCFAQQQTVSIT